VPLRAAMVAVALVAPLVAVVPTAEARSVWPSHGQAAYVLGLHGKLQASPHQKKAPIASIAKVMTAYVVLRRYPMRTGGNGFTMTVSAADVADRARRVNRGESTVPVARGEKLTERQALAALLLPSANNIAIMLARKVSGSVGKFVTRMNSTASSLTMHHTTYTDPSGFDAATRSTPSDQTRLALVALGNRFFRVMVKRTHFWIPVAGTVRNTDTLLGKDGFLGIKTGSMSASGGCFMFRSRRIVHGKVVNMVGVVLGQQGGDLIAAGLAGARRLVDRVAPKAAL
jgi:D-alanyl-D-alanine carboxypeptidase (penicillin-binding protein 5/6)